MVERANKPSSLVATPGLPPQPTVSFSKDNSLVTATLPTGESITVLLYGATVISWKDSSSSEKLWLSSAAKLDGTKPVRGGIPLVFPVFGPPPPDHSQTSSLPQHGFARTSRWEFLGKSTSESSGTQQTGDLSVKLDFGLSSAADGLDPKAKDAWGYKFNLIYSVTLNRKDLTTSLVVTNDDDRPFDCQVLMHTYLKVNDITKVSISGLDNSSYIDKVDSASTKTQSGEIKIEGETDRVYTADGPVTVAEDGKTLYTVTRDNLSDVVVWNPWIEKAKGMGDFEPKDGYKEMLCVEPGSVGGWQTLEKGDAFEGAQTITLA
ncbi:galactose mutarotase-like domain-containing protein [Triangularia verruculosa]|uniref:Glucose-6-phosphate 1-epimerase n=1 Tax=Triangularia verruculosa TaxID=2587418 RepID=A0AAN7B1S0_9PEZI|nr:galactose mutarotase-like domain-containing protein [Triangularia verruculosa]